MVKTERMPARAQKRGKHPHVRREDANRIRYPGSPRETPPRAWGRRIAGSCLYYPSRNTPTCVGKTSTPCRKSRQAWKHPHVRGEDRYQWRLLTHEQETPPRAWGRQAILTNTSSPERNTPTCVGKTRMQRQRARQYRKHPHVRGEDIPLMPLTTFSVETPPRAWGRLPGDLVLVPEHGNTPTCVGKTYVLSCY